jgi:MYXO-CTERM domain-containing protein
LIGQNTDAAGTIALTASNGVVGARGVALNPNGTQFVIALPNGTSGFDLWRYNSNGSGSPVQLTFSGGTNNDFNGSPDISPDGTTIIFQRNNDLWTIGMNGSGLTQITNTPAVAKGAPSWAPNGLDYAYEQLDGVNNWNIYRNTAIPAPEPGSAGLALVGGLALLARRRRTSE